MARPKRHDDYEGLLLTRGQRLVDALIQALIHKPTRVMHTIPATTGILSSYIKRMRGNGGVLIQDLKGAYVHSFRKPQDIHRLKSAARSRKALESYIEKLEIATGKRVPCPRNIPPKRIKPEHYKTTGWCVCRTRSGKRWRILLTSLEDGRPCSVRGTWAVREDARNVARAMIAKLRGEAA